MYSSSYYKDVTADVTTTDVTTGDEVVVEEVVETKNKPWWKFW